MASLNHRFPLYRRLLRLYPPAYRRAYGQQMLQTYADMMDSTTSPAEKLVVRLGLLLDLPLSITKQQLSYTGEIMAHEMPHYVKRNAVFSGLLLVPFVLAIIANSLDRAMYHQSLDQSWAWSKPILMFWVLWLPAVGAIIAAASLLYFLVIRIRTEHKSIIKTALEVQYTWPLLLAIAGGLLILTFLFGHDSIHCLLGSPIHEVQRWHETLRCVQQS